VFSYLNVLLHSPENKMPQKGKSLDLIIDNNHQSDDYYCSGDVVSGHISLKISVATTVKAIKVLLKGYAQVSWMHKWSRCSEERKHLSLSKTLLASTGRPAAILMIFCAD